MCWSPRRRSEPELVRRSCVCVSARDLWCDDDDILAEAPWGRVGAGEAAAGGCAMWRAAGSVRCGDMA